MNPEPVIVVLNPDAGTVELYEHREKYHGLVNATPDDKHHPNGKAIFRTEVKRNPHESVLEQMLHAGCLGKGRDAEIRYLAGCWLRELFVAAHPGADMRARLNRTSTGSRTAGVGGWSEMKIAEVFLVGRVLAKVGAFAGAVDTVCCQDAANVRLSSLRRGLERLAYVLCHPKRSEIDLREIETGRETLATLREKFGERQRKREQAGRERAAGKQPEGAM